MEDAKPALKAEVVHDIEPKPARSKLKGAYIVVMIILSGVYLLNFTFGVFELPDNLPIIGNMDEVAATVIFMSGLRYFGLDLAFWRK